jgi:hypothetical protein
MTLTPVEEKAIELFSNYRYILSIPNAPLGELKDDIAKSCALMAVDEILSTIVCTPTDYGASWTYWQLVKIEINKL